MAAEVKEIMQCFVLAYIQKYPNTSEDDFLCYYSGVQLNQKITTFDGAYSKGTKISPKMMRSIDAHNIRMVDMNNKKGKKEEKLKYIDVDVFTEITGFSPLPEEIKSTLYGVKPTVINKFRPYLKLTPQKTLQFVTHYKHPREWIDKMYTCFISGKALYTSLLRGGGYVFITQDAAFSKLVKNDALHHIKTAMDFDARIDILSSVDFYIVKKTRVEDIKKFIKKNILYKNEEEKIRLLERIRLNSPLSYQNFMKNEFVQGNCFGVSAKTDPNRNIPRTFKVVGDVTHGTHKSALAEEMEKHLDIFTKVMAYLSMPQNKGRVETVLDEIIQFDKVDVRPTQANWSVKVFFDISKISPEEQDLYIFSFEALGTAGYNGHPLVRHQHTHGQAPLSSLISVPYTGGIQDLPTLAKLFFTDYAAHGFNNDRFINKRIAGNTNEKFKEFLKEKSFLSENKVVEKMKELHFTPQEQGNYLADATTQLISEFCRGDPAAYYNVSFQQKMKNFKKAQHFYFLSDKILRVQLKKRIFFTLYGLITKSGYRIFTESEIKSFIQKSYKTTVNGVSDTTVTAEFQLVPHLMLGSLAPY
jgi:hypothetical protein